MESKDALDPSVCSTADLAGGLPIPESCEADSQEVSDLLAAVNSVWYLDNLLSVSWCWEDENVLTLVLFGDAWKELSFVFVPVDKRAGLDEESVY